MRGLCPVSALSPMSHSQKTEVQSRCHFPPGPRAPAAPGGRLRLGPQAASACREGILRGREAGKTWRLTAVCGLDAMAGGTTVR